MRRLGVAYCWMTNHVHIVAIPDREDSFALLFRRAHSSYAAEFNEKYGFSGHLWQARCYSCLLDEGHTIAAVRYVERNPVRARPRIADWRATLSSRHTRSWRRFPTGRLGCPKLEIRLLKRSFASARRPGGPAARMRSSGILNVGLGGVCVLRGVGQKATEPSNLGTPGSWNALTRDQSWD